MEKEFLKITTEMYSYRGDLNGQVHIILLMDY